MDQPKSRKKIFDVQVLKRILAFASPYRYLLIRSMLLSLILALMAPLRPWLIQVSLNQGMQSGKDGFWLKGPGAFIIEVTILQLILLLLESALRYIFAFSTASLGQHVVKDLRVTTYRKITGLNLSQFDRTPIGTLTTRTINDVESVNEVFSDGLIPIIADLLTIISVLTYMFWADWRVTLICLAPFPLLILATYYFKESVNRSFIRVRNAVASLNAFIQEHISGMALVQAFAAEDKEAAKFRLINREHRDANIRAIFAYSVFFPLVELVSALSVGLLVWWAARGALSLPPSEAGSLAGLITSFILCIQLLFRPLRMMADKFNVLQMGMIAGERIFKVLDNPDVTIDKGKGADIQFQGKIEFQKVWFAYNEDEFVLRDIDFRIEPGQTIALVGHTGSGKTSVISLLNRLYSINSGHILIDGHPIESYSLQHLRSQIGVVLQDVFLFHGTVRDNLTLRNPDIREEDVIRAAQLIGLHEFILKLPGGYDYAVMERGATLSLGQRQLLSFARALLYNPSILILDEATSSVDSETEGLIQHAIDTLVSDRTSIIIAHRLSTIRKADKILVLDKGQIRESGTHEELMAHPDGFYRELYRMQFEMLES